MAAALFASEKCMLPSAQILRKHCSAYPQLARPPAACRGTLVQARVIISSRSQRADHEIEKVLFTTEQLNEILDDLGRQIGADYSNKPLLVIGVLKGGFMFTADLIRHIHPVPPVMEVDFFKAQSYGMGIESSGEVKLDDGFDLSSIKDKHVLICEDVIDTGLTMSKLVAQLRAAGAMSVRVVVLLDKRNRRKVTFDADYVGAYCPDEFVVGYGIDYAERYRWLPFIGVPKPEVVKAIMKEHKDQHTSSPTVRASAVAAAAAAAAAEANAAAASRTSTTASTPSSSTSSPTTPPPPPGSNGAETSDKQPSVPDVVFVNGLGHASSTSSAAVANILTSTLKLKTKPMAM